MKTNTREIAMLVGLLLFATVYVGDKLESKTPIVMMYAGEEDEPADTSLVSTNDASVGLVSVAFSDNNTSVELVNITFSGNNTTLEQEIGNAPAPQSNFSYKPQTISIVQPPKYAEYAFEAEMKVSSSPVVFTPWSGNAEPIINMYYRFPNGTAFNDIGMLHEGHVYAGNYVGYNLCTQSAMRFWKWEHMEPPGLTNEPLVYWSEPVPEDPYQLLGTGENCYTRVSVESSWFVKTCYEGDGEVTPYYQEVLENGDTIRYFDPMDACWSMFYKFPV